MARKPASKSKRSKPAAKRAAKGTSRRPSAPLPPAIPASTLTVGTFRAKATAPKATGAKAANTVIYVHGIGNKPVASVLKCQWDSALFGAQLGDRTRMSYWVNREYFPTPSSETCASGDRVKVDDEEASTRAIMAAAGEPGGDARAIDNEIETLTSDPARRAFLRRMADRVVERADVGQRQVQAQGVGAKVFPLPEFARRLIARKLTRAFLRDVNDFLFNEVRRDAMEQSVIDRISSGGGPFVVVAHSQGTMIAYDVLRRLERSEETRVPLFVTMGSPLGMQEVQDMIRQWSGGSLPFPRCVDNWVNVAERLDPVAIDTDISNDFEGKIENVSGLGLNPDAPFHPHSATGYLSTKHVRDPVRSVLGTAFEQAIAPFAIAKDLVNDIENGARKERHDVLIQLAIEGPADPRKPKNLDELSAKVRSTIEELVEAGGHEAGSGEVDELRHFVSARLTRIEVETLRSLFKDLRIDGIWRNSAKKALIVESTHTVQARPANLGYGADGRRIGWAVLDTGIAAGHPHFGVHGNVIEQWDCTKSGAAVKLTPKDAAFAKLDGNGHGTHVAGVVAGEFLVDGEEGEPTLFAGLAPRATLYGFKVLDNQGNGRDSWIIKALDKVARINEGAGQLVIHGVNLSLGGNFDPSVYGCGHTPLCQELRRLWRQGVLVCLAAGNEGYAELQTAAGAIQANIDLSIGDPANLEEAIAVGSVHKRNPHTYGISFFSSRGPTADGRRKPDVVAPGEKILSCRHDWPSSTRKKTYALGDLYVEMSGTSMATPHVSGVLASFLSLRREFIGYPDRVKQILLDACVDLRRDPYMQGSGLPNLIKMLALN